jgi:hypothetical protein
MTSAITHKKTIVIVATEKQLLTYLDRGDELEDVKILCLEIHPERIVRDKYPQNYISKHDLCSKEYRHYITEITKMIGDRMLASQLDFVSSHAYNIEIFCQSITAITEICLHIRDEYDLVVSFKEDVVPLTQLTSNKPVLREFELTAFNECLFNLGFEIDFCEIQATHNKVLIKNNFIQRFIQEFPVQTWFKLLKGFFYAQFFSSNQSSKEVWWIGSATHMKDARDNISKLHPNKEIRMVITSLGPYGVKLVTEEKILIHSAFLNKKSIKEVLINKNKLLKEVNQLLNEKTVNYFMRIIDLQVDYWLAYYLNHERPFVINPIVNMIAKFRPQKVFFGNSLNPGIREIQKECKGLAVETSCFQEGGDLKFYKHYIKEGFDEMVVCGTYLIRKLKDVSYEGKITIQSKEFTSNNEANHLIEDELKANGPIVILFSVMLENIYPISRIGPREYLEYLEWVSEWAKQKGITIYVKLHPRFDMKNIYLDEKYKNVFRVLPLDTSIEFILEHTKFAIFPPLRSTSVLMTLRHRIPAVVLYEYEEHEDLLTKQMAWARTREQFLEIADLLNENQDYRVNTITKQDAFVQDYFSK